MFAARSALVCETPDDAARVAYEMDDGQRYDAVALDGTFYQKSGVISGGSKLDCFSFSSFCFYL